MLKEPLCVTGKYSRGCHKPACPLSTLEAELDVGQTKSLAPFFQLRGSAIQRLENIHTTLQEGGLHVTFPHKTIAS